MPEPKLTILGIYRPEISKETWQEQFDVTDDEEETREHFDKLVLVEAVVEDLEEPFEMIEFGQMHAEFPADKNRMMVGYDEGLLSGDGETLIKREMDCVAGTGPLRFAVYLHQYDSKRPVLWQYGEVSAPAVQEIPARLIMLMPYNACS